MDEPKNPKPGAPLSLREVIDLGEYKPELLSQYPEWEKLSEYARFQLITKGLENRRRQIFKKWAEVVNFIDDSGNPKLQQEAKENIERQLKELRADKERLFSEYTKLT